VLFVNCGSVGKPKDGDPRGSFALLEDEDGDVNVSIERVAYDVHAVAAEIGNVGLPRELADQLVRAE
jgi:diadenosine tetraphosphatase ApaH/serine/threonine PP2A family protein phosphatase